MEIVGEEDIRKRTSRVKTCAGAVWEEFVSSSTSRIERSVEE